jgi:hypothetical protein
MADVAQSSKEPNQGEASTLEIENKMRLHYQRLPFEVFPLGDHLPLAALTP